MAHLKHAFKCLRAPQVHLLLITLVTLTTTTRSEDAAQNATQAARATTNVISRHNPLAQNRAAEVPVAVDILRHLTPFDRFSFGSLLNLRPEPPVVSVKVSRPTSALECGQRMRSYDSRIVGGHVATIGEFPWMISLQREKGGWFGFKAFYHSCGGTLITDSWILTAAHCLYNRDEPLRAVGGTDNLNFLYRAQIRSIERQIIHPDFDITTYNNDIALIKVDQPFNLRSSFSRMGVICLEPSVELYAYDIATICGFGSRAFHERTRTHLYETDIALIDHRVCNNSFGGMITENMLCAGGMIANKRDACSGDSGGPLMMELSDSDNPKEDGQHVSLIGVVSFGNDCALRNYPGIYTRVSSYYDWILDNIDESLVTPKGYD